MLFVIYGEERLLMDNRLEKLKEEYPIEMPELNLSTFDCREVPLSLLSEEITSAPFFSPYRMTVLYHPYFFTTEKVKGASDKEIEAFTNLLFSTDPSRIVVLFQEGKLDERRKLVKQLRKQATFFEAKHPDIHQLRATIRNGFKRRQSTIDDDALELLIDRAGSSLMQLKLEIEKLTLHHAHTTLADVKLLVAKPIEENVFELSNAILRRQLDRIMDIYQDLMLKNEEPVRLIALIATNLRLLYQVRLLDRKGYNDQEISQYLDINSKRLPYIRRDCRQFELGDLLSLLDQLSQLDVAIKNGKVDKTQGLELFLLNVGVQHERR